MPAGELFIQIGSTPYDAYTTWGVSLEDGALASLMAPPSMKEGIVNESRLEHGKRRINFIRKMDERELTLPIHLVAKDRADYLLKYGNFINALTSSEYIKIWTSYQTDQVKYKCIYMSCTQFSQFIDGMAKFVLKLIEPNPHSRANV